MHFVEKKKDSRPHRVKFKLAFLETTKPYSELAFRLKHLVAIILKRVKPTESNA